LEYAYAILLWSSINSVCAGANIMNSGQSKQLFELFFLHYFHLNVQYFFGICLCYL